MLHHYRNKACPEAAKLLTGEEITYSMLINILQGQCGYIITDLERMIVCHSASPWPVWVWCRDAADKGAVDQIGCCLKENFPVEEGFDCILSYELLEALKKEDPYFRKVTQGRGLLSYRLDQVNQIDYGCEGSMGLVREEEIPSLTGIWQDMHVEMEGRHFTREHCEEAIRLMVESKALFAWRSSSGEIVALTGRGDQGLYSKITSVYTLPAHRRKGYAINLVHGVTRKILEDRLIPILYTDAGYGASNACYRKIGYRQVGQLISICK